MEGLNLSSLIVNQQLSRRAEGATDPQTDPPGQPRPTNESISSHPAYCITAGITTMLPSLRELVVALRNDLQSNLHLLLTLNPSRRRSLIDHLSRIADLPVAISNSSAAQGDISMQLQSWVLGPHTEAQEKAIRIFSEEVAVIYLSKAILLKAWSDKGIRRWAEGDLVNLNWSLIKELKPFIPMNREGWELTKANLYSWFNPSTETRRKIWNHLGVLQLKNESAAVISNLVRYGLDGRIESGRAGETYDSRFYGAIWEFLAQRCPGLFPSESHEIPDTVGSQVSQLRRHRRVFTPTLRDGGLIESLPPSVGRNLNWVATESNAFRLLSAELVHLWAGPVAPPLWVKGTGLHVLNREQLSMHWTHNPKPTIETQITEIEACDLAFLFEEKSIRPAGRSHESIELRMEIDQFDRLKKLKSRNTTLGAFQSIVALSKLRQSGLLIWAREEPLNPEEGDLYLHTLLDQVTLHCEWDFTAVQHHLPASDHPFPRYLYFMSREMNHQVRHQNRPLQIRVDGSIRSHVEVPLLLSDALSAFQQEVTPRGNWKINRRISPTPQGEWAEHWPDSTSEESIRRLEVLKEHSIPLGQIATVRTIPNNDALSENKLWSSSLSSHLPAGILLDSQHCGDHSKIVAEPIKHGPTECKITGCRLRAEFLVALENEDYASGISAYLESPIVHDWLNYFADKGRNGWSLREQTIKFIPIPRALIQALEQQHTAHDPQWDRLMKEVIDRPALVATTIKALPADKTKIPLRAGVFVRAAAELEKIKNSQKQLFGMVGKDGHLRWKQFLSVLPIRDCMPFSAHPDVELRGSIPPHVAIQRIEPSSSGKPGILLAADSGHTMHLTSSQPALLEMLWDQIKDTSQPTWSELTQTVFLPRHLEVAQESAREILRAHETYSSRYRDLDELVRVVATAWW